MSARISVFADQVGAVDWGDWAAHWKPLEQLPTALKGHRVQQAHNRVRETATLFFSVVFKQTNRAPSQIGLSNDDRVVGYKRNG